MKSVQGKAVKFGNNIDTDVILPGKWLSLIDPNELAKHAMEGLDPNFPKKAEKCVIIIGGKNFGCGSSREQAPLALKYAGVNCVLSESFARIFYRNAINTGLPVLEAKDAYGNIGEGDQVTVSLRDGSITDDTANRDFKTDPLPDFLLEIIDDGGLVPHLKKALKLNA